MKRNDLEKGLREYLKANPDIIESVYENDMDKMDLPETWKQEIKINSTPEKRMLAHKMMADAMQKVAKQKKRRQIIFSVTGAIVICAVLFLAVTPPGQALARGVIKKIVHIFNGNIRIETEGINSTQSRIGDLEYREFTNIDKASEYAGQQLIYVDDTNVEIVKIGVEASDVLNSITTEYSLPDGRLYSVYFSGCMI